MHGVPQDSVLGPDLAITHNDDLSECHHPANRVAEIMQSNAKN